MSLSASSLKSLVSICEKDRKSLSSRKWEDKEGVTRYSTEIIINDMKMLGSKSNAAHQTARAEAKDANVSSQPQDDFDSDLDSTPF